MSFRIIAEDPHSLARAGELETPHGIIKTPVFMPVGTQATVKGLTPEMVAQAGADVLLSNTYHLALRPGADLITQFGGLHSFMNWHKPILTDSGGYQVFSLQNRRKITDEGVIFKSHIDGSSHRFTPRSVIDLQRSFRSDIMMPLDICTPYPSSKRAIAADLAITHRWEKEALDYWQSDPRDQLLFGLIQGGMDESLRTESVDTLTALPFSGFAIGGVSVGEPIEDMHRITAFTAQRLPTHKPRYLMGVGLPENLSFAIRAGVDMFDCVIPTRLARHGQVFMADGQRRNIKQTIYKSDPNPIMTDCDCYTCQHYSRAYIRHLYVAKEMLAATLMSIHNIRYLIRQVHTIRQTIINQAAHST